MNLFYRQLCRIGPAVAGCLVLACNMNLWAQTGAPMTFTPSSRFYELRTPAMEVADDVTLEAWVKIDPACPEGACILDKWATGSQGGCRLEVGRDGGLR